MTRTIEHNGANFLIEDVEREDSPLSRLIKQNVQALVPVASVALEKVNPADLVANDRAAIASIVAMIAGYNMEQALLDHEVQMLLEACRRFEVTKTELVDAFWKAYADKFTGKRMYFRHLWTHIQAEREQKQASKTKFTQAQVIAWLHHRGLALDSTPYFDFHGEAGVRNPDNYYTLKDGVYDGH